LSPAFAADHTLFLAVSGASSGGAYRSADRGETWTDITGGVLDYYVTPVAVSPRFAQDQTVLMGHSNGPLFISEDAGATWFPLAGLPPSGAGAAALAYDGARLTPLTVATSGVYRYRWPSLAAPLPASVMLEPGRTEPITISVGLAADQPAAAPWEAGASADWLTATPVSGTLPATLTLRIDPTRLESPAQATVTILIQWSFHQQQTVTIPVRAWFVHSRIWLPVAMR
jgi:hypothetical protein